MQIGLLNLPIFFDHLQDVIFLKRKNQHALYKCTYTGLKTNADLCKACKPASFYCALRQRAAACFDALIFGLVCSCGHCFSFSSFSDLAMQRRDNSFMVAFDSLLLPTRLLDLACSHPFYFFFLFCVYLILMLLYLATFFNLHNCLFTTTTTTSIAACFE